MTVPQMAAERPGAIGRSCPPSKADAFARAVALEPGAPLSSAAGSGSPIARPVVVGGGADEADGGAGVGERLLAGAVFCADVSKDVASGCRRTVSLGRCCNVWRAEGAVNALDRREENVMGGVGSRVRSSVVVRIDHFLGARMADSLDHARGVRGVREVDAAAGLASNGAERDIVRGGARASAECILLTVIAKGSCVCQSRSAEVSSTASERG